MSETSEIACRPAQIVDLIRKKHSDLYYSLTPGEAIDLIDQYVAVAVAAAALSDSHAELVKALEVARDWMMVDIEYGDEEQFNIDLALVDAALATLTAREVG